MKGAEPSADRSPSLRLSNYSDDSARCVFGQRRMRPLHAEETKVKRGLLPIRAKERWSRGSLKSNERVMVQNRLECYDRTNHQKKTHFPIAGEQKHKTNSSLYKIDRIYIQS